jgi:hypothetical protein
MTAGLPIGRHLSNNRNASEEEITTLPAVANRHNDTDAGAEMFEQAFRNIDDYCS